MLVNSAASTCPDYFSSLSCMCVCTCAQLFCIIVAAVIDNCSVMFGCPAFVLLGCRVSVSVVMLLFKSQIPLTALEGISWDFSLK